MDQMRVHLASCHVKFGFNWIGTMNAPANLFFFIKKNKNKKINESTSRQLNLLRIDMSMGQRKPITTVTFSSQYK